MKIIPNIRLDWNQYYQIAQEQRINYGGESVICKTGENNSLYKFFYDPISNHLMDMSGNKLQKIAELYKMNLSFAVQPLATVTAGNYLVGYKMTYNPRHISLKKAKLSREEAIEVLKKSKTALEYFASRDITYGDVRKSNVLLDPSTGEIEFCDMDNIRLGEYPIDLKIPSLKKFVESYGTIDEKADAYVHNLMTLQLLNFPWEESRYGWIIEMLKLGVYPEEFEESADCIFESMTKPEQFNGEYAIQYIKR